MRTEPIRPFAFAFLLLAPISLAVAHAEDAPPPAIAHGPFLHAPRADSMNLLWFTDKKCVSWVEYGEKEPLSSKAVPAHHGLIDAGNTRHMVQIEGLEAGKTYQYRVVSKEILHFGPYKVDYGGTAASEPASFRTCDPKKEAFSFCLVSDIHERAKALDKQLRAIDHAGIDFMVLNGDMINHFEKESQIFEGFFDTCVAHYATRLPSIHVRGNHETRGRLARRLLDFAPVPENRFYYAFDHGGVHFIVLDSGEDKPDTSEEYSGLVAFDPYRRAQAEWLARDIRGEACQKARFRVALFHMPTFGGNNWHGEQQIRKLWNPLLNQGGVDLVLCGHTHKAAHLPPQPDANQYDLAICAPEIVIRVDVTPEGLSVTWTGPGENLPESFTRTPLHANSFQGIA